MLQYILVVKPSVTGINFKLKTRLTFYCYFLLNSPPGKNFIKIPNQNCRHYCVQIFIK